MNERIEFDAVGLPVDVDAPGFGAGLGEVELPEPPAPDFPVACHLMHDHDPVACAPEDYHVELLTSRADMDETGMWLLDVAAGCGGLADATAREALCSLLFELSGITDVELTRGLLGSLAQRFLAGEPGIPGAVIHQRECLEWAQTMREYPDGVPLTCLVRLLGRVARISDEYLTGDAVVRMMIDPPFVLRVSRVNGRRTLGLLGNQEFEEASVYSAGDLVRRLSDASVAYLTTHRLFWRAGGVNPDAGYGRNGAWFEVEHQDGAGLVSAWDCIVCGGRITAPLYLPQIAAARLDRFAAHPHRTGPADGAAVLRAILRAHAVMTDEDRVIRLSELRDCLGEAYARPLVDAALAEVARGKVPGARLLVPPGGLGRVERECAVVVDGTLFSLLEVNGSVPAGAEVSEEDTEMDEEVRIVREESRQEQEPVRGAVDDPGCPVPADRRDWRTSWFEYRPVDITPAELRAGEGLADSVAEGWAEAAASPDEISPDEWERRYSARVLDWTADGWWWPLNPSGRTGRTGRNLGRWGENAAADPIVVTGGPGAWRVLLIKREDRGVWAIPGGMVDPGETAPAALVRELREETNVDLAEVEPEILLRAHVADWRETDNAWVSTTAALYRVPVELPAEAADDAADVGWFELADVDELAAQLAPLGGLYDAHRPLLQAAIERLAE
jgi:ADP-ribose pyrophosphatase